MIIIIVIWQSGCLAICVPSRRHSSSSLPSLPRFLKSCSFIILLFFSFLACFPYFEKKNRSRLMQSPCNLCVYVSPLSTFENWYVYHGSWAHLNGVLHKSLPSVCVCISLSLLGNGSVKKSCRHNKYTRRNRRIFGLIVFYAVPDISKESPLLRRQSASSDYWWRTLDMRGNCESIE
jgi:hypothetical protein